MMPLGAAAQGVVEGVVTDASSGTALEYVNVGIVGQSKGTVTDSRGRYSISVGQRDSVTLRFSFTGYHSADRRVKVTNFKHLTLNVQLASSTTHLRTVEVSDDKTRQTTFTRVDVEHLDAATGPTGGVEGMLKMLPDVQSSNELSSQYSVRGGSFDENLVYINGVEVFRPMLIRSGQQEGMSIINPDLVEGILFSPGAFDAVYGDKMSSVLDIGYCPTDLLLDTTRPAFSGKVSVSLLGGAATVKGRAGERLSYAVGLRRHSNNYILGSLDTKGRYTTSYTDFQGLFGYRVSPTLDLGLLTVLTHNIYGLVPESQTTTFGGFMMPMVLNIYFDGQEQDRYTTLLGAFTADWHPNDDWKVKARLSLQHINESERYDVQSQYWLYQLAMGENPGDTVQFDRGVGTFLEHARNRLATDIAALDLRADRHAALGSWNLGLKLQLESISDHLREWKWVDSAGYALPSNILPFGDSANYPVNPILQLYANAANTMHTFRTSAFVQRELNFHTRRGSDILVLAGIRGQLYTTTAESGSATLDVSPRWTISPRASVSYKPRSRHDLLFRLACGFYSQAPFYREYRRGFATDDGTVGSLCLDTRPQHSAQLSATIDWRFSLWDKPFTLTADIYYKYLFNLVPYTVDNLRLRYMPDHSAVGYATGLSLRLNAELVEGLESWVSLSLMKTMEDIEGDGLGWLTRPTDQCVSIKLFLQDNVPDMPWWRMSLNLVFATGTPVTVPMAGRTENTFRLPTYYRLDWGNTVRLSQFDALKNKRLFRLVDDIQVGVEVFNLFNFRNVVSYLWAADYENRYYPVPNYLTARQLNVKLTILF